MTWLLLRKFWMVPIFAVLISTLWWQGFRYDAMTKDRNAWKKSARAYQVSSAEWEASFHQSETMRQKDQERAVQAINASEGLCDQRVAKARSSAVKIERIVTKPAECKPGEAIPRSLVDPAVLADSLR